jgi:hypothetical protein
MILIDIALTNTYVSYQNKYFFLNVRSVTHVWLLAGLDAKNTQLQIEKQSMHENCYSKPTEI